MTCSSIQFVHAGQHDGSSLNSGYQMALPNPFASNRHVYPSSRQLVASSNASPVVVVGDSDRLSKLHRQLVDLKRQIENEFAQVGSNSERQTALGSPCSSSKDCNLTIRGSHCNLDTYTCSCLPHHVKLNTTTCLPRK